MQQRKRLSKRTSFSLHVPDYEPASCQNNFLHELPEKCFELTPKKVGSTKLMTESNNGMRNELLNLSEE